MPELTPAQWRYLDEIREAGEKGRTYNGRATRPIEALEQAGLVEVDWDMIPQVKGGGMELVHRITATYKPSPDLCPGSTERWRIGDGHPICPTCHQRWSTLGLARTPNVKLPTALVPPHPKREG
jgi:hypothetical protein